MDMKIKLSLEFTVSEGGLEDGLEEYDELTVEGLLAEMLDVPAEEDKGTGATFKGAFLVGILLSSLAAFFGTVGKVLMRLAALKSQEGKALIATDAARGAALARGARRTLAIGLVCIVALNPVGDLGAYYFAKQSVIAPLTGLPPVPSPVLLFPPLEP